MSTAFRRKVSFLLLLLAGFICAFARVSAASEVNISSDYLQYDESEKYLVATGSVSVTWQKKVLKAREIRFWVEKKYLIAEGDVSLVEGKNILLSDHMTLDYKTGVGDIVNVKGYAEPWFIYARSAQRENETKYQVNNAVITTCNLPRPHYSIRAKRAKVVLNKRLTIYNPVFYIKSVPVFYLPLFTHSLKTRHDSLEIQPGYNDVDGVTLRAIYGFPITSYSYGKLYLDYFSLRGVGKGAEYDYDIGGKMKGTLYGYNIKENTTGNERWTLRGSHWQKLDPFWTAQAEVEFISDSTFNNSYFQENWQAVTQQIHSFAAVTRQTSKSNFRALVERFDVYNPLTGGFDAQTITAPSLQYTLYPSKNAHVPFYTNFSATLQNQYLNTNGYYLQSGVVDTNITSDQRIGKNLTIKPQVGIRENWQDRTSATDFTDQFITRYYANINARYRALRWMDWDVGYNYLIRSAVNSLVPDVDANDFGEETNQVYFINSMYLRRNLVMRNSTGYNLHLNRDEVLVDWRTKFTPLVNELTWTPSLGYIYIRQENTIYPYMFNSVQADSRWGRDDNRYFSFGVFYRSSLPDQLDFNTGFGFWPTKKWKIDYIVHASALNNFESIISNDQEINIYRDLHCWECKITFRKRAIGQEVFLMLNLKSASKNRETLYPRKQEQEFYPWR